MHLQAILRRQLLARGRQAWALLVFTIPMYYLQLRLIPVLRYQGVGDQSPVHPFCLLLSGPFAVWAIAALWLAVDLALVVWMHRALNRQGEPARPARLFFTWQVVKIAFLLLFLSVLAAFGPADLVIYVRCRG